MKHFLFIFTLLIVLGSVPAAQAQETEEAKTDISDDFSAAEAGNSQGLDSTPTAEEATPETTTKAVKKPKPVKKKRRRRYSREKKAEGTKARERFKEAVTAIRSRYKYKGRTLYVDPD